MSADYSKLLEHPDKEEIISKIMTGSSHKSIADWLKIKYSLKEQSHLRLTSNFLKEFSDNNIDLFNQLRNDLSNVKSSNDKINKKISESLLNNKTYKERLNELADSEIDIKRVITDTIFLIRGRVEQMYDIVQNNPENTKPDYALIKWFETLLNATEKYQKIYAQPEGSVINNNITVNMIEQHSSVLQEAIRDTLSEIDPEIAFIFMDKLAKKLAKLEEPTDKFESTERRFGEVKALQDSVKEFEDVS
jgi:hypothetical protein